MILKSPTEKLQADLAAGQSDVREEDGWIFRERPGLPVECVRLVPEMRNMQSPYHPRHNYPSA